jgi:predicted nucleic acid-binding Zn ribbon protein
MQSMSDAPLTECTGKTCVREDGKRRGRGKISRVLHAPAIHFKGSGFHNTDYGSKRRNNEGDSGSGSDKKSDSSASDSSSSSSSSDSGSKSVGLDKV